jgi:hypothetical protein
MGKSELIQLPHGIESFEELAQTWIQNNINLYQAALDNKQQLALPEAYVSALETMLTFYKGMRVNTKS